jgi:N-acetylglucosaminyldiphosphoundecaprenol N-acetyl-beta-D-mannosaminyltransferase
LVLKNVLGMRVDATSHEDASRRKVRWAQQGQAAYVRVASVHMLMEVFDSREFQRAVNGAILVTTDGRSLDWALKGLKAKEASQVRGTDLTTHVVERAVREGVPLGFYGGTSELIEPFVQVLEARFPGVQEVCQIAPPFRPLTPVEDEAVTQQIVASEARILFVGIGCPNQERWMAAHKERILGIMLGGVDGVTK